MQLQNAANKLTESATLMAPQAPWTRRASRSLRRFVKTKPLGAIGGGLVLLMVLIGVFAPLIAPMSYDDFNVRERLLGPSWDHPMGTDEQGRDVFSRLIYGARTSVLIGFGSMAVGMLLATLIGVTSGYFGGWIDIAVQRVIDIWLSFPNLIFVIFVIAIFDRSTINIILVLGILVAAGTSRLIRSSAISIREMQYIESARCIGASHWRILLRYITPNVIPIIIVGASVQIGAVILTEASLSFLGFGVPPPFPSWGRMLQESQTQMINHPTLAIFPGIAVTLVVFGFNMLGDALRDVLDPRMRGSR